MARSMTRDDGPPARRRRPGVRRRTLAAVAMATALVVLLGGCSAGARGPAASGAPLASGPASSGSPTPPEAVLVLPDGRTVAGVLGSYSFGDRGADAPWIGASGLTESALPSGAQVRVRFADGSRIGAWTASIADAADPSGSAVAGLGGRDHATPPIAEIVTGPTPAGRHVLGVHLVLADGRGDGMYFWLLRSDG